MQRLMRTGGILAAAVLVIGVSIWAVVAQSGTQRPDNDDLDVLAGFPDPGRSIAEDHLAWAFGVMNRSNPTEAEIEQRLSPEFQEFLGPGEFDAETAGVVADGPYRLFGIDVDETTTTAAALVVDRNDATFALSVVASPVDPSRLDGLLINPVEIGRGPFAAGEFAARVAAGLVVTALGLVLALLGRRRVAAWLALGGVFLAGQLLELADQRLAYTIGLTSGSFALAALALAALSMQHDRAERAPTRIVAVLVGAAAFVSVLPLTAVDTSAISLPDHLLLIDGDPDRALGLLTLSGWVVAVACAGVLLVLLLRQFRADWSAARGLVATTLGGGTAAVLTAAAALSAAIDLGRYDLSQSLLIPVAGVVAATGVASTVVWDHYDLGPVAAELEAENTQLQARLAAQLDAVSASRARIVQAGDEARRRLERDLHDGAQQRLVTMRLALQLGRQRFGDGDPELSDFLHDLDRELDAAVTELRELSRGLHPAILERGVAAAAQSLAETCAIPVEVVSADETRCGTEVEHAAYFVVSEALANATRHANATHVEVAIQHADRQLRVTVRDDGIGGARPGPGTGLVNLEDRVLALGGSWRFDSPPGSGTTIEVRLPCG